MSARPEDVITELERLRLQWWLFSTLCNVVLVVCLAAIAWAALVFMDFIVQFDQQGLRIAFSLWLSATILLLAHTVWQSIRRQRSLEATARRVELTFPALQNNLIALVQMYPTDGRTMSGYERAAIEEATRTVVGLPIAKSAIYQTRWHRWLLRLQLPRDLAECSGVLLVLILVLSLLGTMSTRWSSSNDRLLKSFAKRNVFVNKLAVSNTTESSDSRINLFATSLHSGLTVSDSVTESDTFESCALCKGNS